MLSLVLPATAQILATSLPTIDRLAGLYPLDNGIWTDLRHEGHPTPRLWTAMAPLGGVRTSLRPHAYQDVVINN